MHKTLHFRDESGQPISEKGKELTPKQKIIMTTVRDAVLAILDGKDSVTVKRYLDKKGGDIDWDHPPEKMPEKSKSKKISFKSFMTIDHIRKRKKDKIHAALEGAGIHHGNTQKRIEKALGALGHQYKNMDPKRLIHRMETDRDVNGGTMNKLARDVRFIYGITVLFAGFGPEAIKSSLDNLFSDGNFSSLKHSENLGSLLPGWIVIEYA